MNSHQRQEETKRHLIFDLKKKKKGTTWVRSMMTKLLSEGSPLSMQCGVELKQKATQAWDVREKEIGIARESKS